MKKILVIVDSINIEDSSGSKANVALINNLAEAGFEVFVYHYTLRDIKLKGAFCYAIPEMKYTPLYFMSRIQRLIQRNSTINLAPFFERLFGFSFTFFNDTRSIVKVLKKQSFNPDLVITLSKGGSFRPHYAVLKLPQLHDKWMAYVHDPYPFHFYPQPYQWVEPSYKFKEAFFKEVAEKAKHSAFPSQLLLEWMGGYFPGFMGTGVVIPHQNSKYKIQNTVFPSYFDSSKFNLLHAGNLLNARSPKGLIEGLKLFFERCPESKKEVRLLLIGSCMGFSEMLGEYKKNIPELYVHDGIVPFDEVFNIQQNTIVNIILEAKSEISPFLPAKFPHCVAANKTILSLAPYLSEVKRLLGVDYEYWSDVDDVAKIAKLIEQMYSRWKENPENLLLNRIDLQEYLSVDYLKQTIINLKK